MTFNEIVKYKLLVLDDYTLNVYNLLMAVGILVFTKIMLSIFSFLVHRREDLDTGRRHSLILLVKYFVWVIAIIACIQSVGIRLSFLWGGIAALGVGIGLGLQQLFNDLVSGVFLLFEGSVQVEDTIEVDGVVGRVKEINLRTSQIITQDETVFIVPNHKFVSEKVINWSHNYEKTRFIVEVGVAYGSDVELVTRILLECAKEHSDICDQPQPFVRFNDFGESSLNFTLYFWSEHIFVVGNTRSDLRYAIDRKFRESKVEIPFPQRDLHLKSSSIGPVLRD